MKIRSVSLACALAAAMTPLPMAAGQAQTPAAAAKEAPAPDPVRVPMTRYTMTAGDFDGDGISESVVYDTDSKALRVIGYAGPAPVQTMGIFVDDVVVNMTTADLDGDGKDELIAGEGLLGYNAKEGPQTDVSVKIYSPAATGDWQPVEIFRSASERPDVTSIRVRDLDGDGRPEVLFAYMESKYGAALRIAKREGEAWTIAELPSVRMGMSVDAGDVLGDGHPRIVVGRPYGDPPEGSTIAIGDAFILEGDERVPLPVTRGVSSVAVGDLDGDGRDEIVVGDGWHSNYGKLARCRLGVVSRDDDEWRYELVEDLPGHIRFDRIDLVDLNGDGRAEIVGRASRASALGGSVRVYERTASGWRGMTVGELAQAYAAGQFDGEGSREVVFAGQPPLPVSLAASAPRWESKLGEAVETPEIDPASLVGKPAPALQATEWLGSGPQTLGDLRGKVVMLDFWATWCKPCIEMYPEMRTWVDELGPKGLVILGITNHSSQTSAQVERFFKRQKLPWAVAIDPDNRTHIQYGVSPIPHTFLIDRRGILRLEHRGGGDLTEIETKLRELLDEKPRESSQSTAEEGS